MPGKPNFVYWDSCVFLSYINADPERIDILEAFLDEIQKSNGERRIVTSILTKVEVAWTVTEHRRQALSPIVEQTIDNLWND